MPTAPAASQTLHQIVPTGTAQAAYPKAMSEPEHGPRSDRPDAGAPLGIENYGSATPFAYGRDLWERSILFWDTLRQRADNMIAHERAGKPPLLNFDYEILLDARQFERPVNYALAAIRKYDDKCIDDCLDPAKPPVVVVDPRAGHGPGIGGFKRDSEVGIAMHEGHAVYFVLFYPDPAPGQTIADVLHVLRRFVMEVSKRHEGAAPILYGNCQAGWAIAILAADCEGLAGPAVLNGSPLSYWGGEAGINPARVSGGLLGGAWLTHLTADLGNGRFDGAWLVQNFENLKPEAVWEKYANLLVHVDEERDRFLEFERWWNGYYFLSREEMLAIVENLFIGNKFEQGLLRVCECCFADLRRIRNPIVIFASRGDNITPPHQALGWIPTVYGSTEDLKRAGQRIVYLINSHVGHLGIFVSASVARLEHRAILEHLDEISALAPGLYEMRIDNPTGNPDCKREAYTIHFEERRVEELHFPENRAAFRRVAEVSSRLDELYSATLGNWVRATSTPLSALLLEWFHPMRTSRLMFATAFNPLSSFLMPLAASMRQDRHGAPDTNPYKAAELKAFDAIGGAIAEARQQRDAMYELWFEFFYGRREGTK